MNTKRDEEIRVLMLEDSRTDAELIQRELSTLDCKLIIKRVDNAIDFRNELNQFLPTIILADYTLPSFDGLTALSIAREQTPDTPFVFVSGTIGEDKAVEALKKGATDYVIKDRLSRLPSTVGRALQEAKEKADLKKAEKELEAYRDHLEQMVKARTAELKETVQKLQLSEADYRTLVESDPDVVISTDINGTIIDCNNRTCDLLNLPQNKIRGQNIVTFMGKNGLQDIDSLYKEINIKGFAEAEVNIKTEKFSADMWAKMVVVRDLIGNPQKVITYFRDVTERKKLDQLKDEFLGMISHEMRTPLTIIIGGLDTVLRDNALITPDERFELLHNALTESESLAHILENLLDLSRLQANRLTLHNEPTDLEAIASKVLNKFRGLSPHQFEKQFPATLADIQTDPVRIEHILFNLVENAVKYSPRGGEIKVYARKNHKFVTIGVSDQGIGISARDIKKIFEPFQRLERLESAQGSGLGLVVCKRLVEVLGGQIWVESELGQGTTFLFTLPLVE